MIDRRNFVKLLFAAPAIKAIDVVSSNKEVKEDEKLPKALLVDPFQVSMKDLTNMYKSKPKWWPKEGIRLIRIRRPLWGAGEPIRKIF